MDLISASFRYPLRFSSIFWTHKEVVPNRLVSFTCFKTHILLGGDQLRGVALMVGGKAGSTAISANQAYRIEGDVAAGGSINGSILFEDNANTITINHAEVRGNSMRNKVSAQGVGQIVHSCFWRIPNTTRVVEVIKVKHRHLNSDVRVEFYANYVVSPEVSLTLHLDALAVGNVVSLRGSVVGHNSASDTWEIHTAEIQMIYYNPELRRSKRQRCFPPSPSR